MLRHGAREKGGTVLIVHVRLQAILTSHLTRDASQLTVPSRIALALARRGSLWALATLLDVLVLASARLLRRYGRLNFFIRQPV